MPSLTVDKNEWQVSETVWSPVYNKTDEQGNVVYDDDGNPVTVRVQGGVIQENVTFDADGNLILIANGDWYNGDKEGVPYGADESLVSGGQRTGAKITSTRTYGPGSFEVSMKIPAFNGICTSIWLYNYFEDPLGSGIPCNHEIDIEIHGTNAYNNATLAKPMFTSWTTERNSHSDFAELGYNLADGKFHTYRIDWHTGDDPYIEYYVDGVLWCTQRQSECGTIPTNEMYFNIGCWFPYRWCGEPDFETDYMVVESFSYTPFENETADKVNTETLVAGGWLDSIEVPTKNLVANGNFDYDITANNAWTISDVGTATVANGNLTLNGTLTQNVYMDCLGLSYNLLVQGNGNATVKVTYLSLADGSELGSVNGIIGETMNLNTPENCTQLKIEIISTEEVILNEVSLLVNVTD